MPRRSRTAYTLLELLTTVAALVILLGLMVSLSRHVRNASAIELTKSRLRRLSHLLSEYENRHHALPDAALFEPPVSANPDDPAIKEQLTKAAMANNKQMLAALRLVTPTGASDPIFDEAFLPDAWGMPIVLMRQWHPAIGMAPQNRPFFFSAGPDRNYLTQEDNLYSYEDGSPMLRNRPSQPPATGQSEQLIRPGGTP